MIPQPHSVYALFSGMGKADVIALVGMPSQQNRSWFGSPRKTPNDEERWVYSNTPPSLDTEVVFAGNLLKSAEVKDGGRAVLKINEEGSITPYLGYAIYVLTYLLSFAPEMSGSELETLTKQVRTNFPHTTVTTMTKEDMFVEMKDLLHTWGKRPGHVAYLAKLQQGGVLMMGTGDAPAASLVWRLQGDGIALARLS
jgi:hypothetical protein